MNFSEINPWNQAKHKNSSRDAIRESTIKLEALLIQAIDTANPGRFEVPTAFVLGLGRNKTRSAHASNIATQAHLSDAFGELVRHEWQVGGERKLYLLTFALDSGLISSVNPVTPLKAMRAQCSRFLKQLDVTGIGFFEVNIFLNHPLATNDRLYGWHMHVIAIPSDDRA
ncbi:MAG: hypothetical protein EOP50_10535, partial [Sphingobacteriales bacterium]